MKAEIAEDGNAVTSAYDHPVDETFRINRRFIAARDEVLEDRGSRGWEKICLGLSSTDDVLTAATSCFQSSVANTARCAEPNSAGTHTDMTGSDFRAWRIRCGLTAPEAAKALDVSRRTIFNLQAMLQIPGPVGLATVVLEAEINCHTQKAA